MDSKAIKLRYAKSRVYCIQNAAQRKRNRLRVKKLCLLDIFMLIRVPEKENGDKAISMK